MNYKTFIDNKKHDTNMYGFEPLFVPGFLFDFQNHLVDYALNKGRAALYCDCGLGKTPMQLAWAENVLRKTNKSVLILSFITNT